MSTTVLIAVGLIATSILFSTLWLLQRRTGDSGIVDVAWGSCIGLLATFFCFYSDGDVNRRVVVAVLAVAWAARLSGYVLIRCLKMPEDGRYVEMKEKWGNQTDWRMFRFYQFQAIASVLFALPMLIAAGNSSPLGLLDYLGILLWIVAIAGESIADRQLHQFRNLEANRGKVCRVGLWYYSRHPNYFFEWLHWWSYVLFALMGDYGWATIFAPLLMLFFILKVTGIPPTEAQALKSRGDDYRRYQLTTSPFFPWFPKRLADS